MVNYLSYKDVGQGTNTVLNLVAMAPGIRKDLTEYQADGGWVDCDKIRFRDGRAQKIGGWVSDTVQQYTNPDNVAFTGVSRDVLSWVALDDSQWFASGSDAKLEILNGGSIYDITPVRQGPITVVGAIQVTQGSSIVQLTVSNSGVSVGDYIQVVSQDVPAGGITLEGGYEVLTIIDNNNFTVDSGTIATTDNQNEWNNDFNLDYSHGYYPNAFNNDFNNDFGGGPITIVLNLLLASGPQSNGNNTGYGGGSYGTPGQNNGGYGEPRSSVGGINLREWSLDTWGEDLLACASGGPIYHWVKANGPTDPAVPIAPGVAPANVQFCMVAEPSRFVIAFGCNTYATGIFDPLNIRWATEETLTDWVPNQYDTAGEYRLPNGNKIVAAVQTSQEIFVFTDNSVYSMVFLGNNDPTNSIFQFTLLGTNISCISQHSVINLNGTIYWMGLNNFYFYNGQVNILPSTVGRYLFQQDGEGRFNYSQKEKIFAGINKEFNEIIFFYPRFDEIECGHYVKFQYLDNVWDIGSMDRTVWEDSDVFEYPYAISAEGILYAHENGYDDDSQPMYSYIQSAYFDIDNGENLMFVDRIVPDLTLQPNVAIQISMFTKKFPNPASEVTVKGPFQFDDTDNFIPMRARGRQMAMLFESVANGGFFAMGKLRIAAEIDGER